MALFNNPDNAAAANKIAQGAINGTLSIYNNAVQNIGNNRAKNSLEQAAYQGTTDNLFDFTANKTRFENLDRSINNTNFYSDARTGEQLQDDIRANMGKMKEMNQGLRPMSAGQMWASAGSKALQGAALGASIGSFFPGAGTLIGGAIGTAVGGVMGAFQRGKQRKIARSNIKAQNAYERMSDGMEQTLNNIDNYELQNMGYNTFAEGGFPMPAQGDQGMPSASTEFNEGGIHETNPYGGIPIGKAPDGKPNLVEEGEVRLNNSNYILSNRLIIDKKSAEEMGLPKKYIGKTFAEAYKMRTKDYKNSENDPITKKGLQAEEERFIQGQEAVKQKLAPQSNQMSPEEQAALNQQMAQNMPNPEMIGAGTQDPSMMSQQGGMPAEQADPAMMAEQAVSPEQAMMAEQGMMAYGGYLFDDGGTLVLSNPLDIPFNPYKPDQRSAGYVKDLSFARTKYNTAKQDYIEKRQRLQMDIDNGVISVEEANKKAIELDNQFKTKVQEINLSLNSYNPSRNTSPSSNIPASNTESTQISSNTQRDIGNIPEPVLLENEDILTNAYRFDYKVAKGNYLKERKEIINDVKYGRSTPEEAREKIRKLDIHFTRSIDNFKAASNKFKPRGLSGYGQPLSHIEKEMDRARANWTGMPYSPNQVSINQPQRQSAPLVQSPQLTVSTQPTQPTQSSVPPQSETQPRFQDRPEYRQFAPQLGSPWWTPDQPVQPTTPTAPSVPSTQPTQPTQPSQPSQPRKPSGPEKYYIKDHDMAATHTDEWKNAVANWNQANVDVPGTTEHATYMRFKQLTDPNSPMYNARFANSASAKKVGDFSNPEAIKEMLSDGKWGVMMESFTHMVNPAVSKLGTRDYIYNTYIKPKTVEDELLSGNHPMSKYTTSTDESKGTIDKPKEETEYKRGAQGAPVDEAGLGVNWNVPIAGLGLMRAYRPVDYTHANHIEDLPNGLKRANYTPLNNYMTPQYIDQQYLDAQHAAEANAGTRALIQAGAASPNSAAALLANNVNNQAARGQNRLMAMQANNMEDKTVAQHNLGVDQANAQMYQNNSQFNTGQYNQARLNTGMTASQLRLQQDQAREQNIDDSWASLGDVLQRDRSDRMKYNMIKNSPSLYYNPLAKNFGYKNYTNPVYSDLEFFEPVGLGDEYKSLNYKVPEVSLHSKKNGQ